MIRGRIIIVFALVIGACATTQKEAAPATGGDDIARLIVREAPELTPPPSSHPVEPTIVAGNDTFVRAPQTATAGSGAEELLEIDLDGASLVDAADLVLGDILGVNYALDDGLSGTITIKTSTPVSRGAILSLFESALNDKGAVLIEDNGVYRITAADKAAPGARNFSVGAASSLPSGAGYGVQVVPLKYVSATEMERILKPIAASGSILRVDAARNLLMLSGSRRDIDALLEAVRLFDVDWMKGMSFALFPVKSADPRAIAEELSTIFSNGANQPLEGLIRFVPNQRLNAVLVISSRASHFEDARAWINRLDNPEAAGGDQIFVYNVQNRSAESLAGVLQGFFGGGAPGVAGVVQPGLSPATIGAGAPSDPLAPAAGDPAGVPGAAPPGRTRIVADIDKNALLIYSSPYEYQRIFAMLKELDTLPTQVMIEATIAEVSLNNDLKHGLTWFFENAESRFTFSDVASGAVGSSFPGFSYLFTDTDARVALNAIASVTDVKVVSSPTLMVLDNKTARLQVGDQVPVATQSAVSVIDPGAPIVNSVSFRDTGVILSITPRISDNGVVVLDIVQEVSSVVATTTSGIDSPTIQQRRVETSVAVHDGQSLALGGLIEDSRTVTSAGVPLLSEIPVLGEAFKSKRKDAGRTELLILITPRVVRDRDQARLATEEFKERLDAVRDLIEKKRPYVDPSRPN